jgi:hypothetical protein
MSYYINHTRINATIPTSGTTSVTADIPPLTDGWAALISYDTPGFSANVSGDISIYGSQAQLVYSSSSDIMSSGRKGIISSLEVPMMGGGLVVFTLNAIPGCAAGVSAIPSTAVFDIYMRS